MLQEGLDLRVSFVASRLREQLRVQSSGWNVGLRRSILEVPRGSIVVPFVGSYLEFYEVIPERNYYGASR